MSVSLDITKIYCPIRNKNSKTGTERFNLLCNDLNADGFITNKLIFIDPNELLPTDVNNVILCAFSISFNQTIKDMVNDNITPIINILKQCKSTIKVTFISTAYTQPPKPYVLNKNLFSMELSGNSYIEHYNSLINNSCNWNMIKNYEQPKHFTHNTYIYTKVLTENICNYYCNKNNINLNIIRPSQIVVSSLNSKHGSSTATMAGVRAICCKLIRVFNYSDNINAVPVDKVSSNIIQSLKNNKKINILFSFLVVSFPFDVSTLEWDDEQCQILGEDRQQDVKGGVITQGRLTTIMSQMNRVLEILGEKTKVSELEPITLFDYERDRKVLKKNVKPVTIRNEQSTINHMVKFLHRKGICHFDSFEFRRMSIRQDDVGKRDSFTPNEYRKLTYFMRTYSSKAKASDEAERLEKLLIRDYVLISTNTCMRVGELRQLTWGDIERIETAMAGGS